MISRARSAFAVPSGFCVSRPASDPAAGASAVRKTAGSEHRFNGLRRARASNVTRDRLRSLSRSFIPDTGARAQDGLGRFRDLSAPMLEQ